MAGPFTIAFRAMGRVTGILSEQGAIVPVWLAIAPEPAKPELRGMLWNRLKWKCVNPSCMRVERQDRLWNKWCEDAQAPLFSGLDWIWLKPEDAHIRGV